MECGGDGEGWRDEECSLLCSPLTGWTSLSLSDPSSLLKEEVNRLTWEG